MCHHVECAATLPHSTVASLQVVRLIFLQHNIPIEHANYITYVVGDSTCMYTYSSHMQVSVREK